MEREVVEQVVEAVLSRGQLSKEEVVTGWGISDEQYRELKKEVLKDRWIITGPRRRGGFERRRDRDSVESDESPPTIAHLATWEAVTAARLAELLTHRQLEDLLGPLASTLRQVRLRESGKDRRGTSVELAEALVLQNGNDLFCNLAIRERVGKACGVQAPGRWHAGKSGAQHFVRETSFPLELAGIPSPDRPPSHEYLEGRVDLKPLIAFQKEVQRGLLERLQQHARGRGIVTLPTGAGKTRVAVESIQYWLTERWNQFESRAVQGAALWLAHTEELCEQAYVCFRQVWQSQERTCPLLLVRFWGGYTREKSDIAEAVMEAESHPSVLISTPQRVVSLLSRESTDLSDELAVLRQSLGLIVIDEAHRAAARSYRQIITSLMPEQRSIALIGLTATPFRMEYLEERPEDGTRELKEIFEALIEPRRTLGLEPRKKLQEMGILAKPEFRTVETRTRIASDKVFLDGESPVDEEEIERIDTILRLRTDNTSRRIQVYEQIKEIAANPDHSVLYFGPSVNDAECMAFLLRRDGVPTGVVSGNTRDALRRRLVQEFKDRQIRVLCNCEVLTTGFDAPKVSHVVMARPTVSRVLYEQIVGRGLRGPKFGGTERCVIVDFVDNFRGKRPELGYEAFRRIWGAS